jgi:serine palmitoyltransferase
MKTEADVAAHIGVRACIIYAHSFSTISSVIPAFSKRGDIIVADKAVNFAIRKGLQLSRSTVRWYEHNDMADLERVLKRVSEEQKGKELKRKFIVTEGLFENVGDIVDLPRVVSRLCSLLSLLTEGSPLALSKSYIHKWSNPAADTCPNHPQLELKTRHKFRLILDETWSYGILGRTARGATEHFRLDPSGVDMIIGSLSAALCAAGGFCAGSEEVVEHQRLSAAAYTFSAALPAMMTVTASETMRLLQEDGGYQSQLRENTRAMRAMLDPRSEWVGVTSAPESPVMVVVFKDEAVASRGLSRAEQEGLMQEVVDEVCYPFFLSPLSFLPPDQDQDH